MGNPRMRLYVLGPAFGLPSIDADCIAAVVAVKQHCLNKNASWTLLPSHQDESLPRLYDDGEEIVGLRAIVAHLHLCDILSAGQRADLSRYD